MLPAKTNFLRVCFIISLVLLTVIDAGAQSYKSKRKHRQTRRARVASLIQKQRFDVPQCKPRTVPDFVRGLTATSVDNLSEITDALKDLKSVFPNQQNQFPPLMVRVVFDPSSSREEFEASLLNYKAAVTAISEHAYVMGTIADSEAWHFYTTPASDVSTSGHNNYASRMKRFVETMGDCVQVWEIGNEVNGEWTGFEKEPKDKKDPRLEPMRNKIRAQITEAFKVVQKYNRDVSPANPKKTAITLLYNNDHQNHCWNKAPYEMYDWAGRYVAAEVKPDVDYVLLSYYENKEDCPGLKQDATTFIETFKELTAPGMFVRAKAGFGEIGYKASCPKKGDDEFEDEKRPFDRKCMDGDVACDRKNIRIGQKCYIEKYYQNLNSEIIVGLAEARKAHPNDKLPEFMGGYFYWY